MNSTFFIRRELFLSSLFCRGFVCHNWLKGGEVESRDQYLNKSINWLEMTASRPDDSRAFFSCEDFRQRLDARPFAVQHFPRFLSFVGRYDFFPAIPPITTADSFASEWGFVVKLTNLSKERKKESFCFCFCKPRNSTNNSSDFSGAKQHHGSSSL